MELWLQRVLAAQRMIAASRIIPTAELTFLGVVDNIPDSLCGILFSQREGDLNQRLEST